MEISELVELMEDVQADSLDTSVDSQQTCFESAASSQDGRFKSVHILGFVSENNRKYSPDALKNAIPLYEGQDCYFDHERRKGVERSFKDKFGYFENVEFREDSGLWGDLVSNTKHPLYEQFCWWAENRPQNVGLSHHAGGSYNRRLSLVESINVVKSVDIVAKPATTRGLFESLHEGEIEDTIDAQDMFERLRKILRVASDLMFEKLYAVDSDPKTIAENIRGVVSDLANTLQNISVTESQEMDMDWKDIKLSELMENRQDLYEQIQEQVLAEQAARSAKREQLLADVPKEVQTKFFLEMLDETLDVGDEEKIAKLVENQKALVPAKKKTSSTVPNATLHESKDQEPADVKALISPYLKKK